MADEQFSSLGGAANDQGSPDLSAGISQQLGGDDQDFSGGGSLVTSSGLGGGGAEITPGSSGSRRFLLTSVLVLIGAIVIVLGLFVWAETILRENDQISKEAEEARAEVGQLRAQGLDLYELQVSELEELERDQPRWSRIVALLDDLTLPGVAISNVALQPDNLARMTVQTNSFDRAADQLEVYRDDADERFSLVSSSSFVRQSSSEIGGGSVVTFDLLLHFDTALFQNQEQQN